MECVSPFFPDGRDNTRHSQPLNIDIDSAVSGVSSGRTGEKDGEVWLTSHDGQLQLEGLTLMIRSYRFIMH